LTADTVPYLSCDECFDQICVFVEQLMANPRHRAVPMQTHLAACGVCADEAAALVELLTGPDAAATRAGPPGPTR
jgi:hypothetical protein